MLPTIIRDDFQIWNGSAVANHFSYPMDASLHLSLKNSLVIAQQTKRERLQNQHISALRESVENHNVNYHQRLPLYDTDDVIGLVGEILLTDFISRRGFRPVFVKWKDGGTSKSGGIDIVAEKRRKEERSLHLLESKHVHADATGKTPNDCCNIFRTRFRQGIDEFEKERTITNLLRVARRISRSARTGAAVGADVSELRDKHYLIETKMKKGEYTLQIAVLVDSKYCNLQSAEQTVSAISQSSDIGDHFLSLTILEYSGLENVSQEMCEQFVG